jgi:glycogen synthase
VGLEVGADKRLMVFLGRMTHQKGCDLISATASEILRCRSVLDVVHPTVRLLQAACALLISHPDQCRLVSNASRGLARMRRAAAAALRRRS